MRHPAYSTALWQLEPSRSGDLPVAATRGGPISIHWEIHGEGAAKLLFVCGLGVFTSSYQRQTLDFGHRQADRYSVLVLDNRGMGKSAKPLMRYSTSEIAKDVVEVLDHVGWTLARQVHVTGISMGGMISQELACLIPERICTLNLVSTTAEIENTTSFTENMVNRITMLLPKSLNRTIQHTSQSLFGPNYPTRSDDARPPDASTAKVKMPPGGKYLMFNTNYERFAAQELHKQVNPGYTKKGFLLQLIAAGWHKKSAAQLKDMAEKVGRDRITVVHGIDDEMIPVQLGQKLADYIEPGEVHIVEDLGHAPVVEKEQWFNNLLAKRVQEGEKMGGRT